MLGVSPVVSPQTQYRYSPNPWGRCGPLEGLASNTEGGSACQTQFPSCTRRVGCLEGGVQEGRPRGPWGRPRPDRSPSGQLGLFSPCTRGRLVAAGLNHPLCLLLRVQHPEAGHTPMERAGRAQPQLKEGLQGELSAGDITKLTPRRTCLTWALRPCSSDLSFCDPACT